MASAASHASWPSGFRTHPLRGRNSRGGYRQPSTVRLLPQSVQTYIAQLGVGITHTFSASSPSSCCAAPSCWFPAGGVEVPEQVNGALCNTSGGLSFGTHWISIACLCSICPLFAVVPVAALPL